MYFDISSGKKNGRDLDHAHFSFPENITFIRFCSVSRNPDLFIYWTRLLFIIGGCDIRAYFRTLVRRTVTEVRQTFPRRTYQVRLPIHASRTWLCANETNTIFSPSSLSTVAKICNSIHIFYTLLIVGGVNKEGGWKNIEDP